MLTINLRQRRPPLLQSLDDFTARHVMFMSHVYVTTVAVAVSVPYVSFCGRYESIGLVPFFKVLVVSSKYYLEAIPMTLISIEWCEVGLMSLDEDDDYLSDKFLLDAAPTDSAPKTYAQRRKEAEKSSKLKQEQQKKKGRRQQEQESRAQGLSTSLFEAQDAGSNKALSMMMKMGFRPGQSLGKSSDVSSSGEQSSQSTPTLQPHRTEPLSITEWQGRHLRSAARIPIITSHRQEGYWIAKAGSIARHI